MSFTSIRSLPFLSFIVPILAWNVPLIFPIFLNRSLGFPFLLFSSIFLHCSLKKALLSLPAIFWNSAFRWVYLYLSPLLFTSLLFSAICKASSDNHFAFLHFFFFGMILATISCTVLWTSVHSSSGTLSDLIPWIYLPSLLYNHKGFDLGHSWMAQWFFPTFFNLSLSFAIRSSWSESQSAPSLVFAHCTELHHLWLQI